MSDNDWLYVEQVGGWMIAVALLACLVIMFAREDGAVSGCANLTAAFFGCWGVILWLAGELALHAG